jgi:NAD(P)-dependent dehydrogenase (short-subunit alcohol dehydrogenase family)
MEKMETWSVERIRSLFDLTGKVAVVTGGSGALGQAAAKALAAYGAGVVITSRQLDSLEVAAEDIAQTGSKVLAISCDATSKESVDAMMAQTISELGRVDILVTGAGIANRFPAEEFPIDEWQKIMDANVKGTYLCCQAAGREMVKQGGGKVITIGSVRGLLGHPGGYSAYGVSKGAVHLLTKQLSTEGPSTRSTSTA